MAEKEAREEVKIKDALIATMYTQDALIKLLIEKKIFTDEDITKKVNEHIRKTSGKELH